MFEHGFITPNETHIEWSLMIVLYPYITGLVAGAFVVSSLYHVFNNQAFKPVGKFSLLASFAFLACATMPLLNHLGHPERAFNIMLTPHFSSAMAGFGFLYTGYFLILVLEIWLVFRQDIVQMAHTEKGILGVIYKVLALGIYDISPQAIKLDHKLIRFFAAIGIPAACLLHGYVGFLFGALKANPWWSTPLMPVIFLFSAIVSGIAVLILFYLFLCKWNGWKIESETVYGLSKLLWFFLIFAMSLELLEIMNLAYEGAEEWEVIKPLLFDHLLFSFVGLQIIIGSFVPLLLLMFVTVFHKEMHDRIRNTLAGIASFLLLIQVFSMRWNVVIGGQMFSKSFRGFRQFHPHFLEKEGILATIILLVLPMIILYVISKVLPPFKGMMQKEEEVG